MVLSLVVKKKEQKKIIKSLYVKTVIISNAKSNVKQNQARQVCGCSNELAFISDYSPG
jgi:hypothetical protein